MSLKSKFTIFFKKSFVQDVAILQAGAIISTGLAIIASIVFARILGPEKYGIYSLIFVFAGLVGIFENFSSSQLSLTLLSEAYAKKDKNEIKNILTYLLKMTFLITCTVGLIGIIFAPLISNLLYRNSQIGYLARWVLAANILAIFFVFLCDCLQSIRMIKYLTFIEIFNKFFYKLLPIIFVFLGLGLSGIVLGHFFTAVLFLAFSIFVYSRLAKKNEFFPDFREIIVNFKKVRLKKYFKFGFLITMDKKLVSLYGLAPVLFLGMFVPAREVGFFKIAFSYITMSTLLLGPVSRILTVQLPKSKVYDLNLLKKHFFQTSLYSGAISIGLSVFFALISPWLINLFYGQAYQVSISLVYYLAIYSALSGFGVGLGPIFRTINRMDVTIKIHLFNVILGLPIVFYLIKNYLLMGIVWAIIFWSLAPLFLNFIFLIKYFNKKIIIKTQEN